MSVKVPFIDLKRLSSKIGIDRIESQWAEGLKGCEFVGGPSVGIFEAALAKDTCVNHVVSCANGTDALILALQAKNLGVGSKVAIPNLNFWASFEAIAHRGAQAVLIDADPHDLHINVDELKTAHKKFKLDALIMAHLFGWTTSRLQELRDFCREEKIILIDDSAQAFGVEVAGKTIFEDADISTLSFYPAKVLGSCGDAGAVLCRNEEDAMLVRRLGNHGRSGHYSYSHVGWNSRLSGLQARWLSLCLARRDDILESRRKAVSMYAEMLSSSKAFRTYLPPKGVLGNGYLMVLRAEASKRDALMANALEKGVDCKMVYPEAISEQKPAANALRVSDLKQSTSFTKEVINPPMFSFIEEHEVRFCAEVLLSLD